MFEAPVGRFLVPITILPGLAGRARPPWGRRRTAVAVTSWLVIIMAWAAAAAFLMISDDNYVSLSFMAGLGGIALLGLAGWWLGATKPALLIGALAVLTLCMATPSYIVDQALRTRGHTVLASVSYVSVSISRSSSGRRITGYTAWLVDRSGSAIPRPLKTSASEPLSVRQAVTVIEDPTGQMPTALPDEVHPLFRLVLMIAATPVILGGLLASAVSGQRRQRERLTRDTVGEQSLSRARRRVRLSSGPPR